ncbi:SRP54-type protein [Melampsora americana]|nr:SRP54-type protein [Melampsora americana]
MLDHFHIFHRGGIVLWSKAFVSTPSPVRQIITQALIEPSTNHSNQQDAQSLHLGAYSVQWRLSNDLGLVFAVAYQRILQLTYINELLEAVQSLFLSLYAPLISNVLNPSSSITFSQGFMSVFEGWESQFMRLLKELESGANSQSRAKKLISDRNQSAIQRAEVERMSDSSQLPATASTTATDSETIARNIAALKARRRKPTGSKASSRSGTDTETGGPKPQQARRKWDDGMMSAQDISQYDYSEDLDLPEASSSFKNMIDDNALGIRNKEGVYEVADYEDKKESSSGIFTRFLNNLPFIGRSNTSPTLTSDELTPILQQMQTQLLKKNVARSVGEEICDKLGVELLGRKRDGTSLRELVREALSTSLRQILTPRTSVDLLMEVRRRQSGKPYVMTFVGVNGVGKSTNLAKVAFWLLQNRLKVLIAACDTFRSGAVEQLRTHVRNLSSLDQPNGMVELFEKGYGKDAAGIAKAAIAHAKTNGFDVVLIDTAGRMQDNEPLMRALGKLVSVNEPDKVIFVGEALVGNEAVDQLQGFNTSLQKFSGPISRSLDGMILTKFDTIDDQVGAAVSMTFVTRQPIWFVGTGQTYTDLRVLRVGHVVEALMRE